MAKLFPSTPDTSAAEEPAPRVVGLDSDDADDLLAALSAGTAREILSALHEEPDTPADIADRVDTSLQNAQYHLEKLSDAGLIEVIDTVYSEKGREMNVYAPADRPLVVFAGQEDQSAGLKTALTRLFGGVAVLAVLSALVQWFLGRRSMLAGAGASAGADSGGGDGGMSTMATESAAGAAQGAPGLPPGLLFFLGGAVVIVLAFLVWYVRR